MQVSLQVFANNWAAGNSNCMHGSVANAIRGLQKFRSFGCYNISCSSVITYPKFFVFLIQFDKFARS